MSTPFDERRAAEATAFLLRMAGGRMPALQVAGLLYIAERESWREWGDPLIGDDLLAYKFGPTLARTLGLLVGAPDEAAKNWAKWIGNQANHYVAIKKRNVVDADFGALSFAAEAVLVRVFNSYSALSTIDLYDWMRHNCAEWDPPSAFVEPIAFLRLLRALGFDDEARDGLMAHRDEIASLAAIA